MTDLTFQINGHDYSDIVEKRQYKTSYTPVVGTSYMNLNKVKRVSYIRYQGGLIVGLNPISAVRAAELYSDLMTQPCNVTYYSFQRNAVVTESMETEGINIQDGFEMMLKRWGTASTLEFIEL